MLTGKTILLALCGSAKHNRIVGANGRAILPLQFHRRVDIKSVLKQFAKKAKRALDQLFFLSDYIQTMCYI